jgi:hypothetical protein
MIIIWPPNKNPGSVLQQAIQSALETQQKLNNTNIIDDVKLSVKIGFGVGDLNVIYVGGVFGRAEYLATGDPLVISPLLPLDSSLQR